MSKKHPKKVRRSEKRPNRSVVIIGNIPAWGGNILQKIVQGWKMDSRFTTIFQSFFFRTTPFIISIFRVTNLTFSLYFDLENFQKYKIFTNFFCIVCTVRWESVFQYTWEKISQIKMAYKIWGNFIHVKQFLSQKYDIKKFGKNFIFSEYL